MFPGAGSQFIQPHMNVLVQAQIGSVVFGAKRQQQEDNKRAKEKQRIDQFISVRSNELNQKANEGQTA